MALKTLEKLPKTQKFRISSGVLVSFSKGLNSRSNPNRREKGHDVASSIGNGVASLKTLKPREPDTQNILKRPKHCKDYI